MKSLDLEKSAVGIIADPVDRSKNLSIFIGEICSNILEYKKNLKNMFYNSYAEKPIWFIKQENPIISRCYKTFHSGPLIKMRA